MLQFQEIQGFIRKYHFLAKKQNFQKKTEFLIEDAIFAKKKQLIYIFFAFSDIEP